MSNKTPKNPQNETKSALNNVGDYTAVPRKPARLLFAIAIIILGIFIVIGGIISVADNRSRLIAPAGTISIEIVDSTQARALGLSGRESIAKDSGMLFVFDITKDTNCFWMKDMMFAIDMVWLDDEKKVITIEEFVEPSTYPESFCPDSEAKYGLELQADRAAELGIEVGKKLIF